MRSTLLALGLLAAALQANPVATVIFSEIQVAPDSLERLELHPYSWSGGFPFDLGGVRIVTSAGTAVIDPGVAFENESSYVVIDSTNTSGVFSLGDAADTVWVVLDAWESLGLVYPANPWRSEERSLAPPPGLSSAVFEWMEGVYPDYYYVYTWYLDSTPTFGAANDDNAGGVGGTVMDDESVRLAGATVTLAGPSGTYRMTSWSGYPSPYPLGHYDQTPTGPGRFWMTVEKPGYLPWVLPDSLELHANESRAIDVVLTSVGIDEASGREVVLWRGGRLAFWSGVSGDAEAALFTVGGRRVWQTRVRLERGANELQLGARPAPGVYLLRVRTGAEELGRKLVVF